eukprot:1144123-Pelagomonas_calceolata.AAC.8
MAASLANHATILQPLVYATVPRILTLDFETVPGFDGSYLHSKEGSGPAYNKRLVPMNGRLIYD